MAGKGTARRIIAVLAAALAGIALAMALVVWGGSQVLRMQEAAAGRVEGQSQAEAEPSGQAESQAEGELPSQADGREGAKNQDESPEQSNTQPKPEAPSPPARELSWTSWDEEASPNYVTVLGNAVVDIEPPAGELWYSPLDDLGRAGRAAGTITYQMMVDGIARERASIQHLHPSGWGHNEEVAIDLPEGRTYHGYLWNRSHLVAKSLGGADALENLVCGTRTQNVGANDGQGGMAWCEGMVRSWLDDHPQGTVFYSAQPVYQGEEPVCRSVIVDLRSSDGKLDLEVEVHNCARGFEIDYATGEFWPVA